jgi:hypothetical protein
MAAPGWYPDPSEPSRLRLWDGGSWTAETNESTAFTGPTGGTSGGQAPVSAPTPPATPAKRRTAKRASGRWIGPAVIVVVVALVAAVIWGAVGGTSKKAKPAAVAPPASSVATSGVGCPNPLPIGASPAAAAYVHAIDLAKPGWAAVSTKLYAENRKADLVDVTLQADADGKFLTALQKIKFPAAAAPTAIQLETSLATYRRLLLSDVKNFAFYDKQAAARVQSATIRSAANTRLRSLPGIPAATCGYLHP